MIHVRSSTFASQRCTSGQTPPTLALPETPDREVAGEFEVFEVLVKSAVPEVFSPAVVHLKLRTPLPELPAASPSAGERRGHIRGS